MIAIRTPSLLLLALLSLAACAEDAHPRMTDVARIDPAHTPDPHFPIGHENEPGAAKMACTITPTGNTEACRCVTSTSDAFCKAGLDFATHAHFLPAMKDGVAVAELGHIQTVHFEITPERIVTPRMPPNQSVSMDFSTLPKAETEARFQGTPPILDVNVAVHCIVQPSGVAKDCTAHSDWPAMTALMLRFITLAHYIPAAPDGTPIEAPWHSIMHIHMAQDTAGNGPSKVSSPNTAQPGTTVAQRTFLR